MKLSSTLIACSAPALFAIVFLAMPMPKASAEDWCRYNEHYLKSCGFASKAQCWAYASGKPGYCVPNPDPSNTSAGPIHVETQLEMMACQSMELNCVIGGGSARSAYAYVPRKRTVHEAR
jgi:hypothetical protein